MKVVRAINTGSVTSEFVKCPTEYVATGGGGRAVEGVRYLLASGPATSTGAFIASETETPTAWRVEQGVKGKLEVWAVCVRK